jgi:hypothetical protein
LIAHMKQVRQDDDGNGDAQKPKQDGTQDNFLSCSYPAGSCRRVVNKSTSPVPS